MTIVGTHYFVSWLKAVRYYSAYECNPARAVDRKIKEGLIVIGKPQLKPGQKLLIVDEGCRYAIEEP